MLVCSLVGRHGACVGRHGACICHGACVGRHGACVGIGMMEFACMLGLASGIVMPGSLAGKLAGKLMLAAGMLTLAACFGKMCGGGGVGGGWGLYLEQLELLATELLATCAAAGTCPDLDLAAAEAASGESLPSSVFGGGTPSGSDGRDARRRSKASCQQFLICYCARNRLVIWKYYKAF